MASGIRSLSGGKQTSSEQAKIDVMTRRRTSNQETGRDFDLSQRSRRPLRRECSNCILDEETMAKPITDKAEVALEYPDKLYVGTFERSSRFEAHLDPTGIALILEHPGAEDVRKSIHAHQFRPVRRYSARTGFDGRPYREGRCHASRSGAAAGVSSWHGADKNFGRLWRESRHRADMPKSRQLIASNNDHAELGHLRARPIAAVLRFR